MRPYSTWLRRQERVSHIIASVCMCLSVMSALVAAHAWWTPAPDGEVALAGLVTCGALAWVAEACYADAGKIAYARRLWEAGESEVHALPSRLRRDVGR